MLATFIAIILGGLTFLNFAWYSNGGIWLINILLQLVLTSGLFLVFAGYAGPKYERWTFLQNTYWNVRRGLQAAILIGAVLALVAMFMHLK
jgi:hypothetical protein